MQPEATEEPLGVESSDTNTQASVLRDAILTPIHDGIVIFHAYPDRPYSAITMSHGVEAMSGFSQEAFLSDGDLWRRRIHPDDASTVLSQYARLLTERVPMRSRYRWQRAAGHYGYYVSEMYVTEDINGRDVVAGVWTYEGPVEDEDDDTSVAQHSLALLPVCHELLNAASDIVSMNLI